MTTTTMMMIVMVMMVMIRISRMRNTMMTVIYAVFSMRHDLIHLAHSRGQGKIECISLATCHNYAT